jgi:hypothetical protein
MGFLRRILGHGSSPTAPVQRAVLLRGTDTLEVVGESFYQESLRALVEPTGQRVRVPVEATLVAEANNRYDRNAISVWIQGRQVGHLSREDAQALRPGLLALQEEHDALIALAGVIAGGGDGRPSYGVFLEFDPAAFGVPSHEEVVAVRRQPGGEMRTGFRNAASQDAANDAFDLSWEYRMPEDRLQAIAYIRAKLKTETQPVSRHFMFAMLADLLYQAREEVDSALPDFDEVCRLHDAEMDSIRPALIATFGGLPLLEVYKQSAIRHQKAHDWHSALWWARRGLEVYGTDAVNAEFATDLVRRIAKYNAKLAPPPPRSGRVRRPPREQLSVYEVLVCRTCGQAFERERTRGRKPTECPTCRVLASRDGSGG